MTSRQLKLLKAASATVRAVPLSVANPAAQRVGAMIGPRLMADKAAMLDRHLRRVAVSSRRRADPSAGFGSYARYWVESLRLPSLSERQIDRGFSFVGYDRIEEVRAAGVGPILVLPHLGGWEWAAAWLCRVAKVPVTAVVERLEPEDVFEWFEDLRASWGVDVVPLGPDAFARLATAAKDRHILCLLADRDIGGTGVEIEFFGETTRLPVGPAVLSLRTGAPILPTAVYFSRHQRFCRVGAPIWPDDPELTAGRSTPAGGIDHLDGDSTGGRMRPRERYRAVTQRFAREMELLIADAPEQWHLLEPNWPSDLPTGSGRSLGH